MIIVGYVCPLEAVPFGSTLHFTLVLAVLVSLLNGVVALIPMALPAEPCRNLVLLLMQALPPTLRLINVHGPLVASCSGSIGACSFRRFQTFWKPFSFCSYMLVYVC